MYLCIFVCLYICVFVHLCIEMEMMVYNEWLIQASSYEGRITEEMLCAGAPGKDSCQASISLLLICIHICVFLSSVFVFSFYSYLANCKDSCQAGTYIFFLGRICTCICVFISSVFVSFFHPYLCLSFIRIWPIARTAARQVFFCF